MGRNFVAFTFLLILFIHFLEYSNQNPVYNDYPLRSLDPTTSSNIWELDDDWSDIPVSWLTELMLTEPDQAKQLLLSFETSLSDLERERAENVSSIGVSAGLYINGTAVDYFSNISLPSFILLFKTNNTFSMDLSFSSIIGFTASNPLTGFSINRTSDSVNVSSDDFIGVFAISFGNGSYPLISNFTFIPVLNTIDFSPFLLYNLKLRLVPVAFLALSGISHLNSFDHIPLFLRDNIEASIITIQAYYQGKLLLEIPVAYASFALAQGSRDIISFLPLNKSLDVKILFHTKEVGWVTIEKQIEPLGYQNANVSFVMLSLSIAEKLSVQTNQYQLNLSNLGYNLDRYADLLTEAADSLDIAEASFRNAEPIFGYSEIDWGTDGNDALFHAEVSIGKNLRYKTLVDKYLSELQTEPFGTVIVTVALLSLLLSFFLAVLL
ncbi:MAG: hypothetical protein ACFFE8_15240, partial [Candidatus Heimdallarchaeota archaeon]